MQDKEGNKYVLIVDDFFVRKFDSNWKYLKRFGRKDQGPSEVSHSYGCFIDKHSNIYVIDHGNMRVQIFSPDGEPKGSIRMQHQSFSGVVLSPEIIVLTAISFHTGNLGFIDSENPSMLAIADLHAYKVMVHRCNVKTAMDSCTKAYLIKQQQLLEEAPDFSFSYFLGRYTPEYISV